MAQRVHIVLEDDLDATEADETVTFGLDGVTYEIDLSEANAAALREDLARWIGHARRAGGRRSTSRRGGSASAGSAGSAGSRDLADVRAWARKKGYEVSDRGRVAAEILEAYDKAH